MPPIIARTAPEMYQIVSSAANTISGPLLWLKILFPA
jgi:hypothetical protein